MNVAPVSNDLATAIRGVTVLCGLTTHGEGVEALEMQGGVDTLQITGGISTARRGFGRALPSVSEE